MIKIVGIAGSLRKDSFNKMLLKNAQKLCPRGTKIEILDYSEFPIYNQDLEEKNFPAVVSEFKKNIRSAHAVLFAVPEYNFGIPGPLKNAIDWVSRPYGDSAWHGKPVAVMGAAASMQGSARAQMAMRQVLVALNMHPVQFPELFMADPTSKFDQRGNLKDKMTKKILSDLLRALADLTKRMA